MAHKNAEQARLEWNAVWDSPVQAAIGMGRGIYNRFFKKVLLPHASPQSRFLEIGCGTASLLCDLAPHFREVVGLDISERALGMAQERAQQLGTSNISLVKADCFHLPFSDDSFDMVWSQGLHEHFDNYIDILREEYRVCKPGGYVIAGVPYRYSYPTLWYKLSRLPGCSRLWPWTEQVFFRMNDILAVARQISPTAEAYVMSPYALGILIVQMRKD